MKEYDKDKLPSTIIYPEKFKTSLAAGFDGVFDWSWTIGCFGDTKIKPMDFDGVVERKGNFIIFESKEIGIEIPKGQKIALETMWHRGGVTLFYVWGKTQLEKAQYTLPKRKGRYYKVSKWIYGVDAAKDFVKSWYNFANKTPWNGDK